MNYSKLLGLGFILSILIMTFITPQPAQAVAYTINPANMANCVMGRENGVDPNGSIAFALGPAGAPAGVGSLRADVPTTAEGFAIACVYQNIPLSTITTLGYSTHTNNAVATFSMFINIDYDGVGGNEAWQGRLTFEPYQTFTVTPGVWQTWNALNGTWWASNVTASGGNCPQASPCTWATVLALFPNARIRDGASGFIGHKAGSGWSGGVVTYVDNLQFATSGGINDSYDYEPNVPTLTLTKSAPATVAEAEIFNYAVTLNNTSGLTNANNIVIEDVLPAGVTYISNDLGCTEAANTVTCNFASLAVISSITINITVQTVGVSGDILSNTATADADELVAPISSNITNTGVNVVPPVVVVPVVPDVSSVSGPPQCNEPNSDIVAFGLPDGIYCRTLFAEGGWRVTAGAIPVELVTAGAIRAVDIYRVTGGSVVTGEFGGGVPVCLAGVGRMVFLDASTSPRAQVEIRSFIDGNFTCAFLTHSGTLVLMP